MSVLRRTIAGLILFGVSFGYVEAAVVVYLRHIYEPLRRELMPGQAVDDLFPLIDPGLLESREPEALRLLAIELGREAATIAMLAGVALLAGRGNRLAAFAVVFGIWDVSFYAFLKVFIGWPESLATWDLLFLIPVPWTGPVWSPLAVAAAMIACGSMALHRPPKLRFAHWGAIAAGAVLILAAFMWDYREMLDGQIPSSFAWLPFAAGLLIGLGGFLDAWRQMESAPLSTSR
jgi:hypothetical protein